ncbi:MAG: hypothetical protein QXK06_05475 [Candidatus Diapherotrites archaeon]
MLEDSRLRENLSLVFLFVMIVIAFAAVYFLFGKEIMIDILLLTVYFVSFSLLGIVVIYGIWSNPPAKKLQEEMQSLKTEIRAIEERFLKREITEAVFLKLLSEKHQRLIKIEAKIYRKTSPLHLDGLRARLLKRRERAALKRLMDEKAELLSQRRIAACKMYRRELDSESFQEFIKENDANLVKVESLIKILFAKTLAPAETIEKQKREKVIIEIVKDKQIDSSDIDRMARELSEQQKK